MGRKKPANSVAERSLLFFFGIAPPNMNGNQTRIGVTSGEVQPLAHFLRFVEAGVGVRLVALESGGTEVGTDEAAGIQVRGEGVQGRHCRVRVFGGEAEIEALEGPVRGEQGQEVAGLRGCVPLRFWLGTMEISVECGNLSEGGGDATIVWDTTQAEEGELAVKAALQSRPVMRMEFTLRREIARGGMARIYCAHDASLKRFVAVKMSSEKQSLRAERLRREAEVLGMLEHPNIVPVHGMGCDDMGRPFYAMKLVGGRSLQAVLNEIREGRGTAAEEFPLSRLISIFRRVCDALAFAHSRGVIHRDVKPENIMVGGYGEVLLMDWGLAKLLSAPSAVVEGGLARSIAADTDPGMTMDGEVVGTPRFMAPEQARGEHESVGARSDVYCLGGVLHAMLTLRPPVEGGGTAEVLTRVRAGQVAPLEGPGLVRIGKGVGGRPDPVRLVIPNALKAICRKAMAFRADERYASVTEFAADVDAFRNGFMTTAESAGVVRRTRLWIGRNPVLTGSACLLVAVSLFAGAKVLSEGRRAREALGRLKDEAPLFASGAREALRRGDLAEALRTARIAVELNPKNREYHFIKACAHQLLLQWDEALASFLDARRFGRTEELEESIEVTREILRMRKSGDDTGAVIHLFEALARGTRVRESVALAPHLGDYWKAKAAERKKDPRAIKVLEEMLEQKMLPLPGTSILLAKTEFTRAEWMQYMKAEGLPYPEGEGANGFHPVVNVSWEEVTTFCHWFSEATGRRWRLPTSAEWSIAVGEQKSDFPWEGAWPPPWDRGNYAVDPQGKQDRSGAGADGFNGTSAVGRFSANSLGFYDLGGNVWEFVSDEFQRQENCIIRGASWSDYQMEILRSKYQGSRSKRHRSESVGFRVAVESLKSDKEVRRGYPAPTPK